MKNNIIEIVFQNKSFFICNLIKAINLNVHLFGERFFAIRYLNMSINNVYVNVRQQMSNLYRLFVSCALLKYNITYSDREM